MTIHFWNIKKTCPYVKNLYDNVLSDVGISGRIIDADDDFLYVVNDVTSNSASVKIQVTPSNETVTRTLMIT